MIAAGPAIRPPLVRDLDGPVALGVHPAAGRSVPTFIARDVTERLHETLRRDQFVLIVGESTAGKTRAAYETVRALLPKHRLVEPSSGASAQDALSHAASLTRCVVWLDDLERFLGTGGLTATGVREVLADPNRFMIATLRAEEYARFSGPRGVGEPAQEVLRAGWDSIRLASRVDLPWSWSADELARGRVRGRGVSCSRPATAGRVAGRVGTGHSPPRGGDGARGGGCPQGRDTPAAL